MCKFIAEWLQMLSAALFVTALFDKGSVALGVFSALTLKVFALILFKRSNKHDR
jgi:ABC-type uncharacterized transport system permease subunit